MPSSYFLDADDADDTDLFFFLFTRMVNYLSASSVSKKLIMTTLLFYSISLAV